jgi:O-6-methylguanine DNA methyltransferase
MTSPVQIAPDPIDDLLAAHFHPVTPGADLTRRVLQCLHGAWDPERFAAGVEVEATERGITQVRTGGRPARPSASRAAARLAERAREELLEYFTGRRSVFTVPVDLDSLRPFQRKVLALTHTIPFGETRSYSWIARGIGHPDAVRAVGTALGHNPLPFIVPCHRVLRSDGGLGGYALGLPAKSGLLGLERGTPVLEGCATTHIVCRVGCSAGHRMREDSRVIFASVADAESVGYRSCKVCRPVDPSEP